MIKKEGQNQLERKNKPRNQLKSKFVQEQTGSETPKKTSFKLKFIQWLKQLPLDQRYLALKVHAPGLSKKIQETLIDLQNEHIQQAKKDPSCSKKTTPRHSKQIIESIVLISDGQDYFDNIGFDFTYIQHPDKLYQLLTLTLLQSQKLMYLSQQYQISPNQIKDTISEVHKCQSRQQLAFIIITFLRGQIFIKFQQKRSLNLEQEKNRKKQFSMFWRNLSEQFKRRILLIFKEDTKALSNFLAQKNVKIDSQDLEKQIGELILMQKNQFCNKIFKCKLKRSLTYFTDYHEFVYRAWKSELNKKKKRQRNHRNSIAQKTSTPVNINAASQTNQKVVKRPYKVQKQLQKKQNIVEKQKSTKNLIPNTNTNATSIIAANIGPSNKRRRNRNNRRKKSVSAQSKQTKATSHKFAQDDVQKEEEQQKRQRKSSVTSKNCIEQSLDIRLLSNNPQIGKLQMKIAQLNFEDQIHEKLFNDIVEYSDLINEQANEFYERRVIAYQRIQFMLSIWKIPIKLFGSCASGITIKNSDIDIAVDNSILNYFIHLPENNRLKAALEQLQQLLRQQPWVTSLKLIKTAAIPLIKLKVDTSIKFIDLPGFQILPDYLQQLNRDHLSPGQIHIDLTIQTINKELQCNHLGIISTDQINNWLKTMTPLHSLVIIIKNYMTKTNLNITYEGGLNTYSMICMLVAYIRVSNLEEQKDVVKVLQKIAKFYAYQFDQSLQGIDLLNQKNIFYDKIQLNMTKSETFSEDSSIPDLTLSRSVVFGQAELQIKDPLNNGKIMTRNCYSFPKIKDIFKKIHEQCFLKPQKSLQLSFTEQFRVRNKELYASNIKSEQTDQRVNQLLKQCRERLSNPFLTLFE